VSCKFIGQLSRLRKLSAESVENTNTFDLFKEYLHVERQVEIELRDLLRNINANQEKCLVLLCGSAGDGKSHLISYLKNSDDEGLLNNFEPYNDATESSEPTLTSIDTLAEKLSSFNDDNLDSNDGKKMIIAINLGTLNNFIDSEKGKNFRKLKHYVLNNGIFSGYGQSGGYQVGSVFQHVSFSDYQVFSLGSNGIETTFLDLLFKKVFQKESNNPFYTSYEECGKCPMSARCPVRHNYEFLSEISNQKTIIERIVEIVIKDKAIVSTREVLNLIYDLMVHPDFDEKKIGVGTSDVKYLTNYLNWSTPMLLSEYKDISLILNAIGRHDILKTRSNESDVEATRFHSLENIKEVFEKATDNTPYHVLNNLTDISVLGGIKPDLKKIIYRFIARINDFGANRKDTTSQIRLREFIQYLYFQNSGNEKKLGELYKSTRRAILGWNGQFEDDYICIDDTNDQLWLLEQLQIKSVINKNAQKNNGTIQRFSPSLILRFQKANSSTNETAELNMDFSLYELVSDMKDGYRPTVQDKNRHADFVSFVQQLIEFGNKSEKIMLVPKESDKTYKMVFEETEFGYEFKVV
jgi:DNA phosphorothioation-dependent restriction protein DptF